MDMGLFMQFYEQQVSMKQLIPYGKQKNPTDLYPSKVVDTFTEAVGIDKNNLYINPHNAMLVYVHQWVVIELPPFLQEKSMVNQYQKMFHVIEEMIKSSKYSEILTLQRKVYYSLWLSNVYPKIAPKDYREVFKQVYQGMEYQHDQIPQGAWDKFDKTQKQEAEQKYYESLPEILTIYRGETDKSTPYPQAISWTTDKKTAQFFATRYDSQGWIYTAKVEKEDVLAFMETSKEKEVLVTSDKLYAIRKEDV